MCKQGGGERSNLPLGITGPVPLFSVELHSDSLLCIVQKNEIEIVLFHTQFLKLCCFNVEQGFTGLPGS